MSFEIKGDGVKEIRKETESLGLTEVKKEGRG